MATDERAEQVAAIEDRQPRVARNTLILGAMPRTEMYEFLRANLDFAGAVTAARRVLADDRATEAARRG